MTREVQILARASLAALLALGGCACPDAVREDVRRSRREDYERWRAAADRGEAAQPAISGKLSLEDAIKLALQYNQELRVVAQETEIARGRTLEARGRAAPSVAAVGQYTKLDEAPHMVFGDQSIDVTLANSYSASLQVKQPLYAGGAIRSALRSARLGEALSDERVRGQVQRTVYAVELAYYDTLLAQHLYEVNRDAVAAAEANQDDVQKRQKQGTASDYDVLRAAVEVSNFKA